MKRKPLLILLALAFSFITTLAIPPRSTAANTETPEDNDMKEQSSEILLQARPSLFFTYNNGEIIPHPGAVIDIDGNAISQANLPKEGVTWENDGNILKKIITKVQVFLFRILRPTIYTPSARFRGTVEMIIDSIFAREFAPFREVVIQITKEAFEFALPTTPGETGKYFKALDIVRRTGKEVAGILLTIALAVIAILITTRLASGAPAEIAPLRNWLIITLFALNAEQIVYFINDFINRVMQMICNNHLCSTPEKIIAYLFPANYSFDLIPDFTRIFAIAIFILGVLISFVSRWLLMNIVVWLAPIAIASFALPVTSTIAQYWISAYGRLALAFWLSSALFIIAEKTNLLAFSTPVLNVALSLAFATILTAVNSLATFQAIISLKDLAFSTAATSFRIASVAAEAIARMPQAVMSTASYGLSTLLSTPASIASAKLSTVSYPRRQQKHSYIFSEVVINEDEPSFMDMGYFMQKRKGNQPDTSELSILLAIPAAALLLTLLTSPRSAHAQLNQEGTHQPKERFTQVALNVRKQPTTTAQIITTLPCGSPVILREVNGEVEKAWKYIEMPVQGFVAAEFLGENPPNHCQKLSIAFPKMQKTTIYSNALADAPSQTLPCSTPILVNNEKIENQRKEVLFPVKGFIEESLLSNQPCPAHQELHLFVIASALYVRQSPSTLAPPVALLPCGRKVTVYARTSQADWFAISSPVTGFVAAKWLAPSPDPCFYPPKKPFIVAEVLQPTFRTAPSFTAPILWSSPETMNITITGRTADNWLEAFLYGRFLYIEPGKEILRVISQVQ